MKQRLIKLINKNNENHALDFTPLRITEKPPMFGVDKWMEAQNNKIPQSYKTDMLKLETLFRTDAKQQVESLKQN